MRRPQSGTPPSAFPSAAPAPSPPRTGFRPCTRGPSATPGCACPAPPGCQDRTLPPPAWSAPHPENPATPTPHPPATPCSWAAGEAYSTVPSAHRAPAAPLPPPAVLAPLLPCWETQSTPRSLGPRNAIRQNRSLLPESSRPFRAPPPQSAAALHLVRSRRIALAGAVPA